MDGRTERTTEPPDRPFDPAREAVSPVTASIVADVLNQLQNFEKYFRTRQRRRRSGDQHAFEATVSAVLSDLIHRELTEPGAWIAIPLSKRRLGGVNRTRALALNSTLPRVLERLAAPEMSFVEIRKGYRSPFGRGRQTVIRRGSRLLTRILDNEVSLTDLGRDPKILPDPLVMRGQKVAGKRGPRCEIPEGETARRNRAEMDRINAWIAARDICFESDRNDIKDDERFLRRIFNNGSLTQGGRVYGGFWQGLSKQERLSGVLIEGEPVVALDFGQMAARIAYGLVKTAPPTGDLYQVPPFDRFRKGIKAVLNALLAADQIPKRFPMGTRTAFPRTVSIDVVIEAICQRHRPLIPLFGTAACFQIFYVESEILIRVLLQLIDAGITALPVHDCLLVGHSNKDQVKELMLLAFHERVGLEGVVEEEVDWD